MSVRYHTDGRVAFVTLDRPAKLNAMNREVFEGLLAAGRRAGDDPEIRAVVVSGEGRAFSSGLDTSLFTSSDGFVPDIAALQEAFTVFEELPVPTIAAVRGPCLGGGLQLAIACDLRVAGDDAQFSAFEVRWGIIPDLGGTQRLPRLVGLGRAKEMVLSARMVGAAEALAWGLVNRCVAAGEALAEATAWATELAAGPPLALAAAKRLTATALDLPVRTGLARERSAQRRMLASEDFREAVTAAVERRTPEFKAR